jgi:hypothetical protein
MCADPDFDNILMREFSVINQRVRNQRQFTKALDGSMARKFMKKRGPPPAPGAPAHQFGESEIDDVFGLGGDATYDDGSYSYEDDDQARFNNDLEEEFKSQGTLCNPPTSRHF